MLCIVRLWTHPFNLASLPYPQPQLSVTMSIRQSFCSTTWRPQTDRRKKQKERLTFKAAGVGRSTLTIAAEAHMHTWAPNIKTRCRNPGAYTTPHTTLVATFHPSSFSPLHHAILRQTGLFATTFNGILSPGLAVAAPGQEGRPRRSFQTRGRGN